MRDGNHKETSDSEEEESDESVQDDLERICLLLKSTGWLPTSSLISPGRQSLEYAGKPATYLASPFEWYS